MFQDNKQQILECKLFSFFFNSRIGQYLELLVNILELALLSTFRLNILVFDT